MEDLTESEINRSIQICKDDIKRLVKFEQRANAVEAIKWNQGVIRLMKKYLKILRTIQDGSCTGTDRKEI